MASSSLAFGELLRSVRGAGFAGALTARCYGVGGAAPSPVGGSGGASAPHAPPRNPHHAAGGSSWRFCPLGRDRTSTCLDTWYLCATAYTSFSFVKKTV